MLKKIHPIIRNNSQSSHTTSTFNAIFCQLIKNVPYNYSSFNKTFFCIHPRPNKVFQHFEKLTYSLYGMRLPLTLQIYAILLSIRLSFLFVHTVWKTHPFCIFQAPLITQSVTVFEYSNMLSISSFLKKIQPSKVPFHKSVDPIKLHDSAHCNLITHCSG